MFVLSKCVSTFMNITKSIIRNVTSYGFVKYFTTRYLGQKQEEE